MIGHYYLYIKTVPLGVPMKYFLYYYLFTSITIYNIFYLTIFCWLTILFLI